MIVPQPAVLVADFGRNRWRYRIGDAGAFESETLALLIRNTHFDTVEPVCAELRHNMQLNRFTLRTQTKVDGQWKLYALGHNIEKLAHIGYAQKGKLGR